MRPVDWSVVGLAGDPVPGDPMVVRSGGQRYVEIADTLARCAATLRGLEAGASQSQAVTALLETKDGLVDEAVRSEHRYREAGQALIEYAVALDQAQNDSEQALAAARLAQEDAARAEQLAEHYAQLTQGEAASDTATAGYARRQADYLAQARNAREQLAQWVGQVAQAVALRNQAAEIARARIEAAVGADGLNDGWWEDWGSKITRLVTLVAEFVSTITGLLALVVAVIPVVGPLLAAGLLTVSALTGIVAAGGNITLALAGEQSWTEAIVSVAFAGLGCVGLGGLRGMGTSLRGFGRLRGAWRNANGLRGLGGAKGLLRLTKTNAVNNLKGAADGLRGGAQRWRQRFRAKTGARGQRGKGPITAKEYRSTRPNTGHGRHAANQQPCWNDAVNHKRDADDSLFLLDDPHAPYGRTENGVRISRSEWERANIYRNSRGEATVPWPPNDGYVPGTERIYHDLTDFVADHGIYFDRIGYPGGKFLAVAPDGKPIPFSMRAMDPRCAVLPHYSYRLNVDALPPGWSIKVGEIAPALGGSGGGMQLQIIDSQNKLQGVDEVVKRGVLEAWQALS
ncbi:glycohydrolase toxin TNT-related protein [Buchananella hordeovulneris]|uniref:TNT domain-containing protein n=1 Tax=Buchananella hordeovulneris TaxID=52770 RepID=A0A1Q5PY74_9ACTO|nr:glycohydrolase toxin TNT-related protein [Buchananella hordeovulneris]OKL52561.1 hypothetical protein BSZ40_00060 [Buchananella hordeovulneris]